MELQKRGELLAAWADSLPFVTRVWITGGFIQRPYGPHRDLDVAVEVITRRPYEDPYDTFSAFHERWRAHLERTLLYPVHVLHYDESIEPDTPISDGNVVKIVARGSLLVYPREDVGARAFDGAAIALKTSPDV